MVFSFKFFSQYFKRHGLHLSGPMFLFSTRIISFYFLEANRIRTPCLECFFAGRKGRPLCLEGSKQTSQRHDVIEQLAREKENYFQASFKKDRLNLVRFDGCTLSGKPDLFSCEKVGLVSGW